MATWPSTFVAGNVLTAAQMNGIQALGVAWTAFTPTLTAATTNPTGTTYTGSGYVQAGKLVIFRAVITLAATTGTGAYSFALPVASKGSTEQNFDGLITDLGTGWLPVYARTGGGSTASLMCDPTTAGVILRTVAPTVPITFAAGDIITVEGMYEAA